MCTLRVQLRNRSISLIIGLEYVPRKWREWAGNGYSVAFGIGSFILVGLFSPLHYWKYVEAIIVIVLIISLLYVL